MADLSTQPTTTSPTTSGLPGTLALIQTAWHTFHERLGAFLALALIMWLGATAATFVIGALTAGFVGANLFNNPNAFGSIDQFLNSPSLPAILIAILLVCLVQFLIVAWSDLAMIRVARGDALGQALNCATKNLGWFAILMFASGLLTTLAYGLFILPGRGGYLVYARSIGLRG